MIGFLQGSILQTEAEVVILNVRGVGYEVSCSTNTLQSIEGREVVQLFIYTHVREDQLHLFGFSTTAEKKLFLSLIKVNGIGPKMALTVLSATSLEHLLDMIEQGDVKGLVKLPKVGKKTAEQMILSLKGKLVLEDDQKSETFVARTEIISALVNLGFRLNDVEGAVSQMPTDIDLQQGIRQGLSALTAQV